MGNNQKQKLSNLNAGAIIAVALLADGASILLDFIYLGWLVPIIFNGMVFPFWFWLAGVKYNKVDIVSALIGEVVSFIPVVSWIPEITATQLRKIVAIKADEWAAKWVGKVTGGKMSGLKLKVVKAIVPEAAPLIGAVEKGIDSAKSITEDTDPSRTPKRGQAHGERVPSRLSMAGDRTANKASLLGGAVRQVIGKGARVGQEIKVGATLSNATKLLR